VSARMVTFTLDGHLYGVDVDAVQEVLRGQPRTRIPLAPVTLAGLSAPGSSCRPEIPTRSRCWW